MNFFKPTAFAISLSLVASPLLAWGPTGHRAIGLIAEQHMSNYANKAAHAILDGHDLAFASTWPDEIRSEAQTYGYTFPWHYTTWQDDDQHFGINAENKSTGFLLGKINEFQAVLKNPKASKADKAFALKFLVHLVGDLHQPLHVGGGNDKGGNTCQVLWFGSQTNLHAIWDSGIIERTQLSYTELAGFSSQGRSLQQTQAWQSGNTLSWAAESKKLRSKIYPAEVLAPNAPVTYLTYCQENVGIAAMPKLSYEYETKFTPIVYERVYQAGIRLAKILNDSLK